MSQVAAEIFKAYDIRGIVGKSLTAETVELIGKALGSETRRRGGLSCRAPSFPEERWILRSSCQLLVHSEILHVDVTA